MIVGIYVYILGFQRIKKTAIVIDSLYSASFIAARPLSKTQSLLDYAMYT